MVIVSAMAAVGVILVIGLLCALCSRFVACSELACGDVAVFVGWSCVKCCWFHSCSASQFATWAIDWCCLYVAALSAAFAAIQSR